MACLPSSSKCEWADIQHFVSTYNEQEHACFELAECLDVINSTVKMPEVMCKDANSGQIIVIERKALLWPPDSVKRHKAEHVFWEAILDALRKDTSDAPYLLRVEMPPSVNHNELKKIAGDLAEIIRLVIPSLAAGGGIRFTRTVMCSFSREYPDSRDWDEPKTGLKIETDQPIAVELLDPTSTPEEFTLKISGFFSDCVKKFSTFPSARRILLFNCVSSQIYTDCGECWWQEYLRINPAPDEIDEIWSSHNYYEDKWAFERLHYNPTGK